MLHEATPSLCLRHSMYKCIYHKKKHLQKADLQVVFGSMIVRYGFFAVIITALNRHLLPEAEYLLAPDIGRSMGALHNLCRMAGIGYIAGTGGFHG